MKFLLILLVLCTSLCTLHTTAQSKHVYEDSSILYPPEMETAPVAEDRVTTSGGENNDNNETIETEMIVRDTQLINNRHFLSPDSVKALRNTKQFAYAKNLDSLLQDLKKQSEARKAKDKKEFEPEEKSGPSAIERFFNSKGLQYFLWGLAALFVLFVIYKLFFAGGAFQKATAKSNVKVIDEEEAKPVQGRNFDSAITKAVNENNYRLAVRYMYLQLLQRLSAAGAIEYTVDKTNTEYLRELSGRPYKEAVAELTRYYDYVWYGEFTIDAAAWSKLESRFRNIVI